MTSFIQTHLNLLTYNVYFNPKYLKTRIRAISNIIQQCRPAVIGFQEITEEILDLLRNQPWFQFYDNSIDHGRIKPRSSAYFSMLLSAHPVISFEQKNFKNSGMGRELIYAKIKIDVEGKRNENIIIGTSHFESLQNNFMIRKEQIEETLELFSKLVQSDENCVSSIFMGDTNMLNGECIDSSNEQSFISNTFQVGLASSFRSTCRKCCEKIQKNDLRVAKLMVDETYPQRTIPHWHHVSCFATRFSKEKELISYYQGFFSLSKEHQETLLSELNIQSISKIMSSSSGPSNGWQDLWLSKEGNTNENGYTFDGRKNLMISNKNWQSRFDRMWMFQRQNPPSGILLNVSEIQMLGTNPILNEEKIWPSDHFGLFTSLEINHKNDGTQHH